MGVGTPVNILEAIERGVDMFDCVMPTRNGWPQRAAVHGRRGHQHPQQEGGGRLLADRPPKARRSSIRFYTKACYLHHLVTCGEMLAAQIASLHNIAFTCGWWGMAREHIAAGDFKPWKDAMVAN